MASVNQFTTAQDFWHGMVEPDYCDYRKNTDSLRHAFHVATSLFHMSDWVFHSHESAVKSAFTWKDSKGNSRPPTNEIEFANALEQQNDDFGRIRGIANAAKHLKLKPQSVRPVKNAPSSAANTSVQRRPDAALWLLGFFPTVRTSVVLAGPNGNDMEFAAIVESVYNMWVGLKSTHGW